MSHPDEHELTLTVPAGYRAGERLDAFLTRELENASRSKVQRGIKKGRVKVNGEAPKKSYEVQAGDHIVCRLPKPPPLELVPEDIPLDVRYEDDDLLVVNKPARMVVHPAHGHRTGTLVHALLYHVGGRALRVEEGDDDDADDAAVGLSMAGAVPGHAGQSGVIRPGLVHRLDKDTSGLMVVAKHDVAHTYLAKQFAERTIGRRYLALVWGLFDPREGRIEGAIGRDPRDRKKMAVVPEEKGKSAATNYETVEPFAYGSLVRFRLETGRTHQIRVHARRAGHPVLGDTTYGGDHVVQGPQGRKRTQFYRNLFDRLGPRQALHAHTLAFDHPSDGRRLMFEADLPEDMQHVVEALRRVEPPFAE